MSGNIYSAPRVYDLAFSYRNYEREVSELMAWHRDVSRGGRPPESVLELACGPGRHMLEFARAGIRGWGVEISEAMCALQLVTFPCATFRLFPRRIPQHPGCRGIGL